MLEPARALLLLLSSFAAAQDLPVMPQPEDDVVPKVDPTCAAIAKLLKAPVISVLHERDQIATAQERKVLGISQEKVTVSFQLRPSR